jgi:uncharacterized protein (TIGR02266 family)
LQGRKTILWVDDIAMFRELGALFLARSGRVITAQHGEEALTLARKHRPDLIVADLFMPVMNGEDLCRFVRSDPDLCEVPFVMMVGSDLGEDYRSAVQAGADDVLSKPISRVGLNAAVNRFLRDTGTQGLPRVPVLTPVDFEFDDGKRHGIARNISRGGLFLETRCAMPDHAEVQLHFALPGEKAQLSPTAEVVWQGNRGAEFGAGVGMRFTAIDGPSVRKLEDFVGERSDSFEQEYPVI